MSDVQIGLGAVMSLVHDIKEEVARYSSAPYTIAGGCLRDAFFGRPIKDIDLVIGSPIQWVPLAAWPDTAQYGPTGEFMASDTKIMVRGEYPVQLVYRDGDISASSMVKYHSLSISNFFFVDGLLVIDPQALQDFKDQRHTLNTTRWCNGGEDDRLAVYVKKIQAKYPWEVRS
jgi:hypothetical protein